MLIWILIAVLFIYLLGLIFTENSNATESRPALLLGTLCEAIAVVAFALGIFGLLMAVFLGIYASTGVHLAGNSLRGVLLWSAGLIALGVLLFIAAGGARRIGARRTVLVANTRGR